MDTDRIDLDALRAALAGTGYTTIDYVDTTGSTNADLLAAPSSHRAVLLAGEQTAGRGRLGRAWSSPVGGQLIASVALTATARRVEALGALPLAVGVALTDALPAATLKWPNDLLIDDRKLAGILAEAAPAPDGTYRVVIGFGVNTGLSRQQLPVPHATSLRLAGVPYDMTALAGQVLRAVDKRLNQWEQDDAALVDDYRAACASIGQRVKLDTPSGTVEGTVDGVGDDGRIIVDGRAYSAGDVTHLRRRD